MKALVRLCARLLAASTVLLLVLVLAFAGIGSLVGASTDDGPLVVERASWTIEDRQLLLESLGLERPLLFAADPPTAERTVRRAWQALADELARREALDVNFETESLLRRFPDNLPTVSSPETGVLLRGLADVAALRALGMAHEDVALAGSAAVRKTCAELRGRQIEFLRKGGLSGDADERGRQLQRAADACATRHTTIGDASLLSLAGVASLPALIATAQRTQGWQGLEVWSRAEELAPVHPPKGTDRVAFMKRWWQRHGDEFTDADSWTRFKRSLSASRLGAWLGAAAHGDFGDSTRHHRPVAEVLRERLPATLRTGALALALIVLLAIPLALVGLRGGRRVSLALDGATALALALPETVLAVLALVLFDPSRGSEMLAALVLASGGAFYFATHLRVRLAEVFSEPWVFALRMRGVRGQNLFTEHLLLPALGPVVTLTASALPLLVSGSLVVESMFGVQGMGAAAADAIFHGDLPLAMASITFGCAATLASWWLAAVVLVALNPRRNAGGVGA